jgi:hypothetical protein
MEANQTDVEYPQSKDQVDGQVAGIAGGIMDLLENTDPNSSGTVVSRREEPKEIPVVAPAEQSAAEEPDKFTIKWQGQDKEVTQDELFDLAQKGFDYTQKTQALAQERDQLAPYQGLAKLIQSDPLKANQIAAILSGQQPKEAEKPKFDDPIEQLKWETKQETLAEVRREMRQNLVPLHRQQALSQIKQQAQADPDYKEIHQKIIELVKAQPPSLQKTMYLQLDQDPKAYMEAFQHFKKQMSQEEPSAPIVPKPTKKETHAPILESGGVAAPEGVEGKAKSVRISKLKAKAFRTGDPTALSDWLKASGAIDHLF